MKINVTCQNCQRVMRVDEKHRGKKGKCPACGTVNLIQEDDPFGAGSPPANTPGLEDLPVAKPIEDEALPVAQPLDQPLGDDPFASAPLQAPVQQPVNPYSSNFDSSDFNAAASSPYRAPSQSGRRQSSSSNEPDIPGILSVVAGGLSLLGLLACFCIGPVALVVLITSIAGLILGFFAKPPLKAIGISLNAVALVLLVLLILVVVGFFMFADPGMGNGW